MSALHEVVWTLDHDTTISKLICHAPVGSPCRTTCLTCRDEGRETVCVPGRYEGHEHVGYSVCREAEFVNEILGPNISEAFSEPSDEGQIEIGRLPVALEWDGDEYWVTVDWSGVEVQ